MPAVARKREKADQDAPLSQKERRVKERDVMNETVNMEEYLTMEEELNNDQDGVVNNIRDTASRFEHLTRVLKTKQKDCHSSVSWFMIMTFVPVWLYAAIFVSLTMDTYRKDVN